MVKVHKMAHKSKDDEDGEDISMLRTPIQLHGKPMEQILNGIHYGTPELRSLLMDECDIIFECKVCRALFRDLANFISHKRRYCTKSFFDDNYLAIAKIPDEKVYVIQPQEPESSKSNECQIKPRPKPSLEETVTRIQSGELGHSHAFNVYTEAVNKLQRQKEDMKVATIRTRAIPTNPNAVFMDVNMTSVNIHERSAATAASSSNYNILSVARNARERMNANKVKAPVKKVRSRILRKDCKNSEELQKLLMKELKEIQIKVKQKNQHNDTSRPVSAKKEVSKVRNDIHLAQNTQIDMPPSMKASTSANTGKQNSDSCHKRHDKQDSEALVTKSELKAKCDKSTLKNQTTDYVKESKEKQAKTSIAVQEIPKVNGRARSSSSANYRLRRKSLICQKCHSIFSSRQSLSFHNKIIHSPKKTFFPCLYCPSVFYYFYGVTRHLKLSHSKSKSEINSLRKQLRAKAYSKVLPEIKEPDTQQRSTGLRKSLRHKQEAFSSQTSPSSTFVLHSMKKLGKKLSAKKDALSTSDIKEESKDLATVNKKDRNIESLSGTLADSKISIVKTETEIPSSSCRDSIQQSPSVNRSKQRSQLNELKRLSLSPKQSPPRSNLLHTCKKCHRVFGRVLTLRNHMKVCQGKPTGPSQCSRGRTRKSFPVDESHISTRSCKTYRNQSLTPVSRRKRQNTFHQKSLSVQNSRSSSRDAVKSERLSRQEDPGLKSSGIIDRTRKNCVDRESSKMRSSSMPPSSNDKKPLNKSHKADSKTSLKQPADDQHPKPKAEKKGIIDSLQEGKLVIQKSELNHPSDIATNCDSKANLKTSKVSSQKSDHTVTSLLTDVENEMESDVKNNIDSVSKDSEFLRNARSMKYSVLSEAPVSESSQSKSKLVSSEINRDKRSNSVEKDMRSKISHLVPRSPQEISAAYSKDVSNSLSALTIVRPEERPRRKRKVPTRNLEAMEMLSKIHNPDKDTPPCKKSSTHERDSNPPKPSRGRSVPDSSHLKSQSLEKKEESRPQIEEDDSKDREVKEGRLTKSRSRMFVIGRNKPRGRKLLRSYDNARVDKLIDIQNSKCLVCGEQCTQLYNLRRHIIRIHLQWSRYQCKLCRFSSFDRSECTTHIIRNHRRVVNIEDAQAVNCFISDLAKQGSRVMNMKKKQTLRDKNRLQSKETNIYARPNVRKMPRLAERTLIHEKAGTDSSESMSSPEKERSEGSASSETNLRFLRHHLKTETTSHDTSDNSSKKNSLPFNISTRNSPRVFDIRPYKTSERTSSDLQEEIIVLHTRKSMYTKTVPLIPMKEKSEFDDKETNGNSDKSTTSKDDKYFLQPVSSPKVGQDLDSSQNHDIDDHMKFSDDSSNSPEILKTETMQPSFKEIQGMKRVKCSLNPIEKEVDADSVNAAEQKTGKSDKTLSPIGHPPLVSEPKQTISCQEFEKDQPASVIDSPTFGCQVSSVNNKLSHTVSVSSHSPKDFKTSPLYVVIKPTQIPSSGTVNFGASSSTVAKALHFSDSNSKDVTVTAVGRTIHSVSNSDLSVDKLQSQPQATGLDDMNNDQNSTSLPLSK